LKAREFRAEELSLPDDFRRSFSSQTVLYLIDDDPRSASLIEMRAFTDGQRELVQNPLDLELAKHARGEMQEIVLLEAAEDAGLRRTHGRCFATLETLAAPGDRTGPAVTSAC